MKISQGKIRRIRAVDKYIGSLVQINRWHLNCAVQVKSGKYTGKYT